jgi:type I restriction enzyme R subunit
MREVAEGERQKDATNLTPEAFAVFWALRRQEVPQALQVAQAAAAAFEQHPHWQTSGQQEHEVRQALYKALIDAGVDGVIDVAAALLKMLRRAQG